MKPVPPSAMGLKVLAVGVGEHGDGLIDGVFTRRSDALDRILALEGEGNHDLVGQPAFLDFAEPVGRDDAVAGFREGREGPEGFPVERVGVFAALEENARHGLQVILQSVIDAGKQAGTEGDLEHFSEEFDIVAVLESAGAFEHLDRGFITVYLDDLGEELLAADGDVAEFILRHRPVHGHGHEVRDDARYLSFCTHIVSFCFLLS